MLRALKYPRTDGFSVWKWKTEVIPTDHQLIISITYPVQLEVVNVRHISGHYHCIFTVYNEQSFGEYVSIYELESIIPKILSSYSLVIFENLTWIDIPELKTLKFPSIQGPFKNKWVVDVAIPKDQTQRVFRIALDKRPVQYDVFVCALNKLDGETWVTIKKREHTVKEFIYETYLFQSTREIAEKIQSIIESYGMLDLISSQEVFPVKNIITYDMRNQPLPVKIWNDVELSNIDFPQTNGDQVYEWVVSDRSLLGFEETFGFSASTPYLNYLSVTLKSPCFKNVLLIASIDNVSFDVAYQDLRDANYSLTRKDTPEELRQCIRSVLATYNMHPTATPSYAAGSQAKIWSCIGKLSDIIEALQ